MVVLYIVPEKICSSFFITKSLIPFFPLPFLYSMPLKGIFNVTHLVPLYCNYIKPCRSIGYFMCRHILLERIGTIVSAFLYPLLPAHCPHFFVRRYFTSQNTKYSLSLAIRSISPPDTCSYTPGSRNPFFSKNLPAICSEAVPTALLFCFIFSHCARKTPFFRQNF